MLGLLRLAFRNVLRHQSRTLLVALVAAYVVVATLVYLGLMDAYADSVRRAHARYIWAPVVAAKAAWFSDPSPEHGLDRPGLKAKIEGELGRPVAERLLFSALLSSPYKNEGLEVLGVDPRAEPRLSEVPKKVAEGRWLEKSGEVVLGERLARRLDVRLGERIVVSTAQLAGPKALGLKVVGLLRARVSNVDRYGVYLTLKDARRLTGLPTATYLAVDAPLGEEPRVAREVQRLLPPGYAAKEVWELVGPIKTDVELGIAFARVFGWLLALLSALAVTTTLYVSVLERTRELGVIEALGMTPGRLALLVTLEGALAAALGWGLGLVLGYAILYYAHTHNVLGPLFALSGEVWPEAGLFEVVYTPVRAVYALSASSVLVTAALFALLFPARRVMRTDPASALRWEA